MNNKITLGRSRGKNVPLPPSIVILLCCFLEGEGTSSLASHRRFLQVEGLGGGFKDSFSNTSSTWMVLRISVFLFKEEVVYIYVRHA